MTRDSGSDRRSPKRFKILRAVLTVAALLIALTLPGLSADVNVLIIGSQKDIGDASSSYGSSVAFQAAGIKTQLESILNGAGLGTVNVVYEDRATAASGREHNLISWFFYSESGVYSQRNERWPNLRGESGTDWDYVVLIGDPFTMEYAPGVYAHGVAKVADEVSKGGAETILLMPWPGAGSERDLDHYREVVYRTGRSGGHKVAPAGLAWQAAGSPTGGGHPNADGAYIAAASIYSRIWNQSASTSTYTYNDALANTVYSTVTNNVGVPQYSGLFEFQNAQAPFRDRGVISTRMTINSSSERAMVGNFGGAVTRTGAYTDKLGTQYYVGRSTSLMTEGVNYFPWSKILVRDPNELFDYRVRTDSIMAHTTYQLATTYRNVPYGTMAGSIWQEDPSLVITADGEHLSYPINVAGGTYIYTVVSGRTPLEPKPDPVNLPWLAMMAGYEMGWHVTHCQSRAPGFQAKPTSATIGKQYPELIRVRFYLKPRADVTVSVSVTDPGISLTTNSLTFTPDNYNDPQNISLLSGGDMVTGTEFEVNFVTSSDDEVYDNLPERWAYVVNTLPVCDPQSIEAYADRVTPLTLSAGDDNGEALTFRIDTPPEHGTVELKGEVVAYRPNDGYLGPDVFTFVANDGSDDSLPAEIRINVISSALYDFNLLKNGSAELLPFEDYGWSSFVTGWVQKASTRDGSFAFAKLKNSGSSDLYQDVDVGMFSDRIDHGDQSFEIAGLVSVGLADESKIVVSCMDSSQRVLGNFDSGVVPSDSGGLYYVRQFLAPTGTRTMRVFLVTRSHTASFDAMSLVAKKPKNQAPVAEDQSNVRVTSEIANAITLSATDIDIMDHLTYQIIDAPQQGTLTQVGAGPELVYQTDGAYVGADQFTFRVYDDFTHSNIATVRLDVVDNQRPTIVLDSPVSNDVAVTSNLGVMLETTVEDDGKPNALSLTWTVVSGSGVTFTAPNSADTGVFGYGTCVVRLTASDGELTATHDVTVRFGVYDENYPSNIGPYNQSGASYSGRVGVPVNLYGSSASDFDVLPNGGEITTLWRQVSGPGIATFADATVMHADVIADTVGEYTLRFIADDGGIQTYTDAILTITADPANAQPAVSDLTVSVDEHSVSNAMTLTGADADGDPLTFRVIDQPTHGTLGGTAPNLTYTPNSFYYGSDSFTYRANDGTADSALGTVSITVAKVSMDVDAGEQQTVEMIVDSVATEPVSGPLLDYNAALDTPGDDQWTSQSGGTVWNFDAGALSPKAVTDVRFSRLTHCYEFPAAKAGSSVKYGSMTENLSSTVELVIDIDSSNGSIFECASTLVGLQIDVVDGILRATLEADPIEKRVSYQLAPEDMSRFIHVIVTVDMVNRELKLYVDGVLKDTESDIDVAWASDQRACLGKNDGGPDMGSTDDFVGKIAIFRVYKDKLFTDAEVAANFRALTGMSAAVNLNGAITGGTPVQTSWSMAAAPGGMVFGDPSLENTDATFALPGRYTLALTADDGTNPQVTDVVTINVLEPTAFAAPEGGPYRLTVMNGTGSGLYGAGTEVTVKAVPPAGYTFTGWTLDTDDLNDVNSASTIITMPEADVALKPIFAIKTYTVTFIAGDHTILSGGSPQDVTVQHGSDATAPYAYPDSGYTFVGDRWVGGSYSNVTSDQTLTTGPVAVRDGYYLLKVHNGEISMAYGSSTIHYGSEHVISGTSPYTHYIQAETRAGYEFDKWIGDVGIVNNVNASYTSISLPSSNSTITATYIPIGVTYDLTVNDGSGSGSYEAWTVIPLQATVPAGYTFIRWSGDTTGIDDVNAADTSLIMQPSNSTVTATIVRNVALTVTGGSGSGTYLSGTTVPVVAIIPDGYRFDGWTGDTTGVADIYGASTTIALPETDVNIEATFALDGPNLPPIVNAGGHQVVPLAEGAVEPVAGAYYEWDAAQDTGGDTVWTSSTANNYSWTFANGAQTPTSVTDARFTTLTQAYEFPAAMSLPLSFFSQLNGDASATWEFVLDTDSDYGLIMETGNGKAGVQFWIEHGILKGDIRYLNSGVSSYATVSYPLTLADREGFIHVVYVIDMEADLFKLYVNNVLVDSKPWEGILWSNKNKAGLGCFAQEAPAEPVQNFTGKMALVRFYDSHALSDAEVNANFFALRGVAPTFVTLDGTVDDPEHTPLTTLWSLASANPDGLSAWFYDATAVDTTAVFSEPGIYTLRLAASDGEAIVYDDVDIEVTSTSVVHTLSYTAGANGSVSGDTSQTVNDGADGTTVTAVPDAGYEFVSWSDGSTNNPRTDSSVTSDITVTANFDRARTSAMNVPIDWLALNVPDSTNDYEGAVMLDHDGDGFATWQEYWCGTDPMDPESYFKIESIEYDGTRITIKWSNSRVDADLPPISIQGCADLGGGTWSNLATRAPANGMNSWSATEAGMQFYRLEVTAEP